VVQLPADPAQAPQLTDPLPGERPRQRRRPRPTTRGRPPAKVLTPQALSKHRDILWQRPQCNTSNRASPGPGGNNSGCGEFARGAPASAACQAVILQIRAGWQTGSSMGVSPEGLLP